MFRCVFFQPILVRENTLKAKILKFFRSHGRIPPQKLRLYSLGINYGAISVVAISCLDNLFFILFLQGELSRSSGLHVP